jgi:hypothetical protein
MLGKPHFVETDLRRTCGGPQDAWAYTLPSGRRGLILLDVTLDCAELFGDPPDLGPVLRVLGLSWDDPRESRNTANFVLEQIEGKRP